MLQALGEAASDNNTSTNVLHGQDLDDLLVVPDNDNVDPLLDNGSVLSCGSADFPADLPDTETAGALSSHTPLHAPSSDAVGYSNEKTALPQE